MQDAYWEGITCKYMHQISDIKRYLSTLFIRDSISVYPSDKNESGARTVVGVYVQQMIRCVYSVTNFSE